MWATNSGGGGVLKLILGISRIRMTVKSYTVVFLGPTAKPGLPKHLRTHNPPPFPDCLGACHTHALDRVLQQQQG